MWKIKKEIYIIYPEHSASRSGLLVTTYKERGGTYKGTKDDNKGLGARFRSEWTNQRGETGYKYKADVYRPNKRINKDTPTTFKELTKEQIDKARVEKSKKGRVNKFDK